MLRKIFGQLFDGIAAGLLITIGCCVFLALSGSDSTKWVGAILFSVALLTICYKGYSLYTGRIGFLLENLNKDYISGLLLGLLGNVIATAVVGIAVQYAFELPDVAFSMRDTASSMCQAKLMQEWWQTLIRGILCGVLMYVAVAIYKEKRSIVGVLFAIPVFILSGFEHSIADMGYFAIGGVYSAKAFGFIWLVILGNTIGALILPSLGLIKKQSTKKNGSAKTVLAESPKVEDLGSTAEQNIEIIADNNLTCETPDVHCENAAEIKSEIPLYTADIDTLTAEGNNE